MRVALVIPAGFALGAIACALVLSHAPPAIDADRRAPLIVVTYWQQFGGTMFAIFASAIAIATLGYVATLVAAFGHKASVPLRTIVVVCAIACAAALAFPVTFSSDVYAYAVYGKMLLLGINPYAHASITFHDALVDAALWQWGNPPPACVYGVPFVALAAVTVAIFAPLGTAAPLWALRIFACLALIACAPFAYAIAERRRAGSGTGAAALIVLNPVAIWSSAEGHNDVFAIAAVLGALAVMPRRNVAGSVLMGMAGAIKAPAFAAAAAFAVYERARRPVLASATLTGMVAGIVLCLPVAAALLQHVAPHGSYGPAFSLQYLLSLAMPLQTAVLLCAFLCGSVVLGGARAVLRGDPGGWVPIAIAAWLFVPNPYPWYALWLLPLTLLTTRPLDNAAILLASIVGVARYYGDATTLVTPAIGALVASLQLLPLITAIAARTYPVRPDLRENRTRDLGFARIRFR